MPKVTDDKEAHLRRLVRDAIAIDPLISLRSLRDHMEVKIGKPIHIDYLNKLVKKVRGEVRVMPERENVAEQIGRIRETNRILREGALKIAYGPLVKDADRLRAMELIAKLDNSTAKLELDFGIFTRKLGEIDVNHNHTHKIVDGRIEAITKAFENWGMAPPEMRRIEMQRIVKTESNESKPTTSKPTATTSSPIIPVVIRAGLVTTE